MSQDTIYLDDDNNVVIDVVPSGDFAEEGLLAFSEINVEIGGEQYSSITNPTAVIVTATQIRIDIQDVTSLVAGDYFLNVIGVFASGKTHNLNPRSKPELSYVKFRTGR